MAKVYRRAVHERAPPNNALDSASLALADRRLVYAPLAEGPMEPDAGNSALAALADHLDRDFGVGGDYDSVDCPWNRGEVGVTRHAFDFRCVWIDWECFVAGVTELAVDRVGCLTRLTRHARYGDAFAAEELGNGLGYVGDREPSRIVRGRLTYWS